MNDRSNLRYWKMGLFYYNPKDPLLVVPKLNGMGWTLNFGNRLLYKYLLILLLVMAVYGFIRYRYR